MAEQNTRQNQRSDDAARRDDENRKRFMDQSGLEASDLPGGGRDEPADTNMQKELSRNLPQQHGGGDGPDQEGGLRGDRDISDADDHGNRGRN
jgi:hypothetical protein